MELLLSIGEATLGMANVCRSVCGPTRITVHTKAIACCARCAAQSLWAAVKTTRADARSWAYWEAAFKLCACANNSCPGLCVPLCDCATEAVGITVEARLRSAERASEKKGTKQEQALPSQAWDVYQGPTNAKRKGHVMVQVLDALEWRNCLLTMHRGKNTRLNATGSQSLAPNSRLLPFYTWVHDCLSVTSYH